MDFEHRLLTGVEPIYWGKSADQCFPGALAAVMRYLGEPVSDDFVMGISGGPFITLWGMPWSPANTDLLVIGDEPVRRAFETLGYHPVSIDRDNTQNPADLYRSAIRKSIDQNVPVIAKGIIGPPECCVVTGYKNEGEVLYGWSYYQRVTWFYQGNPDEPFIVPDWERHCNGLILIDGKASGGRLPPRKLVQNSLRWAVALARLPEFFTWNDGKYARISSGLRAYDTLIEVLGREEDYPPDDLQTLTFRAQVLTNDGIPLMEMKRQCAARFLLELADFHLPGFEELLEATNLYRQEAQVLHCAAEIMPLSYAPETERLKLANHQFREEIRQHAQDARRIEEQAVQRLEAALIQLEKK